MKTPYLLSALSLVLVLSCAAPQTPQAVSTEAVPGSAERTASAGDASPLLIPARYSKDWSLPSLDRWDTYWQEQYRADSTGDLRARNADMDGDGVIDHALFLCRTDTAHQDTAHALVISFGNGRDTLLAVFERMESEGGIGMGLALEPPGPLSHPGGGEDEADASTVKLEHPAVTVIFFEKASITWYWAKGTFRQVWTGD